jgi:hypothetical protein
LDISLTTLNRLFYRTVSTPQDGKNDSYSTCYWECSDIKITFILTSKTVNKMEEQLYLSGHSKLIPLLASGYFLHDVPCV